MSTKVIIWKGFQMFSKNGRIEASPALIFVHLRNKIFLISVSSKCRLHAVSCSWARMSQFCTKPSSSSISPGRWLSTKVGLSPCRPDAGYCLPPSLLLHLLLLLQVPGRHRVSAHHGHPPGLQLGRPGHLHWGVRAAKPCRVEAGFTLCAGSFEQKWP